MLITKAALEKMGTTSEHFPETDYKEIVLSGRSNVGKSSFINSLVGQTNLAYTSSQPGKTQTLNFYNINDAFYFVDVPGYGYAKVSKKQREEFGVMIENYFKTRKQLVLAILLVDFRHEPSEDDLLMYRFLKFYHIKTIIVATKADKVGITLYKRHEKMIKKFIQFDESDYFITYSSLTGLGKETAWKLISNTLLNRTDS